MKNRGKVAQLETSKPSWNESWINGEHGLNDFLKLTSSSIVFDCMVNWIFFSLLIVSVANGFRILNCIVVRISIIIPNRLNVNMWMLYGVVDIPSEWCKGAPPSPDPNPGNPASGESPSPLASPLRPLPTLARPEQSRASYAQCTKRCNVSFWLGTQELVCLFRYSKVESIVLILD